MATESVATKLNTLAASLDGLSGVMGSIVDIDNIIYAHRAAFVAAELLDRLNAEVSQLALQVSRMKEA